MPLPEHLAELDRRYRARLESTVEQLRRSFEDRLRAANESFSAALADVRVEGPETLFDAAELAPLDEAPRRAGERATLVALHGAALAFDRAASQGAVLDALLAGARHFAPRVGLLIAEVAGVRGWGGAGFGSDLDPLAGCHCEWRGAALEQFAEGRGVVHVQGDQAADLAERLGVPAAAEAVLVPLVLRDRIAAALYADRGADEPELAVEALELLALGAAQRIELQPLAARASTPTLVAVAGGSAPGLALWDPEAVAGAVAELGSEPAEAATALADDGAPIADAGAEWVEEEAAGAVFELEPEPIELAVAPAPDGVATAEPAVPHEPALDSIDSFSKSGIEELFEPLPEVAAAPEAAAEPASIAWRMEPAPAAPVPAPEPAWSGPEVISWAEAPTEPAAATVPEAAPWAGRDTVSWAVPAPAPPSPPPSPSPAPEPEWDLEESEATVFMGTAAPTPPLPAPPAIAAPEAPPEVAAREESTAPFALPVGEPPAATAAFDAAARGASTHEIALPELPEVTAPIPTASAFGATVAVPGFERPPAVDLGEDATVLVPHATRPEPSAPPPVEDTDDATQLVARRPEPAPEPPEDSTHPSLHAPRPSAEEDANDRTAARVGRTTEVAPPPDLQGPGLAFTMNRTQRATGENALHEEARRLARLLVSEIKLYNEEQVEEGRRHRDLYLRLKEDIDRSRQIYDERVHDSVRGSTDYFQQELIRSLAGGDPRALGI